MLVVRRRGIVGGTVISEDQSALAPAHVVLQGEALGGHRGEPLSHAAAFHLGEPVDALDGSSRGTPCPPGHRIRPDHSVAVLKLLSATRRSDVLVPLPDRLVAVGSQGREEL